MWHVKYGGTFTWDESFKDMQLGPGNICLFRSWFEERDKVECLGYLLVFIRNKTHTRFRINFGLCRRLLEIVDAQKWLLNKKYVSRVAVFLLRGMSIDHDTDSHVTK